MPNNEQQSTSNSMPDVDAAWSSPRDAAATAALSNDCLGAITRCETGARGNVRESAMRTVAGVAASYASAGQHIAVKTISTLKKMTPEELAEWDLTEHDLKNAERVCFGVRKIWNEATGEGGPSTVAELRAKVEDKAMRLSRLDDDDLKRMLQGAKMFQELRAAMEAAGGRDSLKRDTDKRNEFAKSFCETSPLPNQLGIREQDLRIYIRTGFGEDRAAWQRLGLEKPPAGKADDKLGARIKAAAEARGGWLLPSVDVGHAVHKALADSPVASDGEMLRSVVTIHAGNPRQDYLDKAERYFRELRESRRTGKAWTMPGGSDGEDAPSSKPAAQGSTAPSSKPAAQGSITDALELGSSVGKGADNRPDDVRAVALRLQHLGYLGEGVEDVAEIAQAIRDFQTKSAGFKRGDGRVDPGGKTLRRLNKAMSAR